MPADFIQSGLVSVTFRKLSPAEIIDLCVANRLTCIEWGGDIHVPHGDVARATEVGKLTRDAGLSVAAYGSYYRARTSADDALATPPDFADVLASAVALGAPLVRVWAGNIDGADASPSVRSAVSADLRRICDAAAKESIEIALEYHGGTLTGTFDSTIQLLQAVDHPNLRTLWQPRNWNSAADNVAEIYALAPWIANVHVFYWPNGEWRPLGEGAKSWARSFDALRNLNRPVSALLEFVVGETPAQLADDAASLHAILESIDER